MVSLRRPQGFLANWSVEPKGLRSNEPGRNSHVKLPDIAICILRFVETMFTVLVDYDIRGKFNRLGLLFIPKTD